MNQQAMSSVVLARTGCRPRSSSVRSYAGPSTRFSLLLPPLPPPRGTSTSFAPVDFGHHRLDRLPQRSHVLLRNGPDHFVIHLVIVVASDVADAANLRPGNVGMSVCQILGQPPRRLGNDLDIALDRAAQQLVGEVVGKS